MDRGEAAGQIRVLSEFPVVYLTEATEDVGEIALARPAERAEPVVSVHSPANDLELQTAIDFALYTRRAENVLKEGDKWVPSILRSLHEAVIVTDTKACITMMNAVAETLTGQRQAEAQGKNLPTLFPLMKADARTLVEHPVTIALRDRVGVETADHLLVFIQSGETLPIRDRAAPILAADGRVCGAVLAFQDNVETSSSVRMYDPSALLSRLTHELKNPLESILGDGHDLLEKAQRRGAVQHQAYLEQLRRSALSTLLLVSNYLDFSRIENGHLRVLKQPIDLNELLQRVEHQYAAEAAYRQIIFTSSLEAGLPMIEADPPALERVFANLVHNGLKFTPASGQVTIHSFRHENVIAAMVTDAGPGMAAEEVPLLFKKYRRMFAPASSNSPNSPNRPDDPHGPGLGLFVAHTLVQAHGGRIDVQSAPGQGSRFTVLLPFSAESKNEIMSSGRAQ